MINALVDQLISYSQQKLSINQWSKTVKRQARLLMRLGSCMKTEQSLNITLELENIVEGWTSYLQELTDPSIGNYLFRSLGKFYENSRISIIKAIPTTQPLQRCIQTQVDDFLHSTYFTCAECVGCSQVFVTGYPLISPGQEKFRPPLLLMLTEETYIADLLKAVMGIAQEGGGFIILADQFSKDKKAIEKGCSSQIDKVRKALQNEIDRINPYSVVYKAVQIEGVALLPRHPDKQNLIEDIHKGEYVIRIRILPRTKQLKLLYLLQKKPGLKQVYKCYGLDCKRLQREQIYTQFHKKGKLQRFHLYQPWRVCLVPFYLHSQRQKINIFNDYRLEEALYSYFRRLSQAGLLSPTPYQYLIVLDSPDQKNRLVKHLTQTHAEFESSFMHHELQIRWEQIKGQRSHQWILGITMKKEDEANKCIGFVDQKTIFHRENSIYIQDQLLDHEHNSIILFCFGQFKVVPRIRKATRMELQNYKYIDSHTTIISFEEFSRGGADIFAMEAFFFLRLLGKKPSFHNGTTSSSVSQKMYV